MARQDNPSKPSFRPGDAVEWRTSQGVTEGTVQKKVTRTARVKGHTAHASAQAPQYEVKSSQTGQTAIHKPESLSKAKKGSPR